MLLVVRFQFDRVIARRKKSQPSKVLLNRPIITPRIAVGFMNSLIRSQQLKEKKVPRADFVPSGYSIAHALWLGENEARKAFATPVDESKRLNSIIKEE